LRSIIAPTFDNRQCNVNCAMLYDSLIYMRT